ncbi:MAG: LysE family translocator [Pseudomonadota bacterium]|nr:LysE family translocator [Pseudomonadota bacterium]
MPLDVYLAYLLACTVLVVIPGPTVMLVVANALSLGKGLAMRSVIGVGLGDLTAMIVSFVGLGAVLAASADLFTVLKLVGAAYLVWLGIGLWRARPDPEALKAVGAGKGRRLIGQAWLVTALNPKGIVFFVAFVPQFMDASAPALPQFVILGATFFVVAVINAAAWAWLAGSARARISRVSTLRWINRAGGSVMIGAGLLTATLRRV